MPSQILVAFATRKVNLFALPSSGVKAVALYKSKICTGSCLKGQVLQVRGRRPRFALYLYEPRIKFCNAIAFRKIGCFWCLFF